MSLKSGSKILNYSAITKIVMMALLSSVQLFSLDDPCCFLQEVDSAQYASFVIIPPLDQFVIISQSSFFWFPSSAFLLIVASSLMGSDEPRHEVKKLMHRTGGLHTSYYTCQKKVITIYVIYNADSMTFILLVSTVAVKSIN